MQKIINLPIKGTAAPELDARYLMSYAERVELIGKNELLEAENEQLEVENERLKESNGRLIQMVKKSERTKERMLWVLVIGGFITITALFEMMARAGGMMG